jgi:hypothetical protein
LDPVPRMISPAAVGTVGFHLTTMASTLMANIKKKYLVGWEIFSLTTASFARFFHPEGMYLFGAFHSTQSVSRCFKSIPRVEG